jgi:carboxymethylenebutenolidase
MLLKTPEGQTPDKAPTRRTALASLFTAGYALAVSPPADAAITTDSEGLAVEEVTFTAAGGTLLPGYLARPAKKGRYPAIVVANEIFGIHDYIKDVCRRYAKAGYVALAPDYFDRAGDPSTPKDFGEIRKIVAQAGFKQVSEDTDAAAAYLAARKDVAKKRLGVTGFCWGGNVVWMAAARNPAFKAGVAYYGRLVTPPKQGAFPDPEPRPYPVDVAKDLKVPVLGLYGEKDQGIPLADVEAMRAAIAAAGNPTKSEIIVYPGAQHGFHADYRPSYDEASAKDAWSRTLAWFAQHGV